MVENPLTTVSATVGSAVSSAVSQVQSLIDSGLASAEELLELETLKGGLESATSASNDLLAHADTLLFGDDQGTLISGGIGSNAGQALGAINLDDTLNSLGGSITETCDLITDFFGSVLGLGQDLLESLASAVQDALSFITNAIDTALGGISAAISVVVGAVTSLIGAITSVINEVISLIASELAAFAEWMAKQIDFALGSFFAGAQDNPCLQLLLGGVGTAALFALLD